MSRKKKTRNLDAFLRDTLDADPRRLNYPQKVRQALLVRSLSEREIAETFGLRPGEVEELLGDYKAAGANLVLQAGKWRIDRHLAPDSETVWTVKGKANEPYRFGLVADTHIGSKHCRLDVLDDLYNWFAREGITRVYHAGNWIEGEARFNKHELDDRAHGMQAQLDLMVEQYPHRRGIETHYVSGDDHEGWYSQREGVDIGRMLQDTARRAGRKDLVSLGYKECFITLEHPKTKRHARMLIDHPGGGSAYAISYAAQKRIEAAQGGEKPAIWAFGHWHKHGYFQARNVHAILVPCTKDLDTFGRKKGLEYHVGGVIIEAEQHEGGAITQLTPRFRMYYDRGYYNQQYNLSGPVAKR
jgi:hypothetical protein